MKEIPKEILDGIKWSTYREPQRGGQHCGMPNNGVKLTHEELEFEISTRAFRSQIQAKEFCWSVFELFLQEIKVI